MWYLILAYLLGMGNPVGTGSGNGPIVIQTADDGGDVEEGDEGNIIPPIPPRPKKP